jgi:hypothetical protein
VIIFTPSAEPIEAATKTVESFVKTIQPVKWFTIQPSTGFPFFTV